MNSRPDETTLTSAAPVETASDAAAGRTKKDDIDLSKVKRPRDPRLDFFRGIAMFIILIAHTSYNSWTLWIPARFGFSDATEIFVFCSGMASALAFASVFDRHSWLMGTARVAHRVWQVYWAHIGLFLAVCLWVTTIDVIGDHGDFMKARLNLMQFFERDTPQQLFGLMTLTYVPNYFDILPMYIVILVMIPIVMALARISPKVALGFCAVVWLAANGEQWTNWYFEPEVKSTLFRFPAEPWNNEAISTWYHNGSIPEGVDQFWERNRQWFFNPFGWQLIFFTGFAFMRGWIPAPPINKWLITASIAFIVLTIPLAWFRVYNGVFWDYSELNAWLQGSPLKEWRDSIRWLIWKTDLGLFRYVHFLAVAYIAWIAVGEGGKRLISSGLWGRFVKIVMKVGQQSLAIFLFSMLFAQVIGYTFYPPEGHPFHITGPQDEWRWLHSLVVNVGGMITLIFVAYSVAWFKKQPWRNPPAKKPA